MKTPNAILAELVRRARSRVHICPNCENGEHESLLLDDSGTPVMRCDCACHMGNALL